MGTEINTLYESLSCYKHSIFKILNKIDEVFQQAVNSTHSKRSPKKKCKIAVEIVETLQHHIKTFYTYKDLFKEIKSRIAEEEESEHLKREKPNSNPFKNNFFNENENASGSIQPENDQNFSEENKNKRSDLHIFEENNPSSIPIKSEDFNSCANITAEEKSHLSETGTVNTLKQKKCEKSPYKPLSKNSQKNDQNQPRITFRGVPSKENFREDWCLEENNKEKRIVEDGTVPSVQREKVRKNKEPIFNVEEDCLIVGQTCVICHIESPSEFYVRLHPELFDNFQAQLNEELNRQHHFIINSFKTKEEAKICMGNFCLGYLQTRRKWYRVQVLDWLFEEPERIVIQLIDYGETYSWNYTNLKKMTEIYAMFPKMAIRCHIAGIIPHSFVPNKAITVRWSHLSKDYFVRVCETTEKTEFTAIFAQKDGISYAVDLRKTSDPDADTLGELLVKNNHAFQVQITEDTSAEECPEEYDTINELITGYDAKDEARICPLTDSSGRCFKGPACRLEHGKLSRDGVTSDKILTVNQAQTKLVLPETNEIINVLITEYQNTCHFYVHIVDNLTGCYNKRFKRLIETMKANNLVHTYEPFKIYPGIGELVLVKDGSDWYRGRCISYVDDQNIEVFLVDFGSKIIKQLKDLKQMKEDFLHVPLQAVECILFNCQERSDAEEELSRNFFDEAMKMKAFTARVVESTEPLKLQLWDSENMDMCHVLKQCGLGEDRENNYFSDTERAIR